LRDSGRSCGNGIILNVGKILRQKEESRSLLCKFRIQFSNIKSFLPSHPFSSHHKISRKTNESSSANAGKAKMVIFLKPFSLILRAIINFFAWDFYRLNFVWSNSLFKS
jgi:hypothetical protein